MANLKKKAGGYVSASVDRRFHLPAVKETIRWVPLLGINADDYSDQNSYINITTIFFWVYMMMHT